MKNIEKYNNKVRRAISNKYVKCSVQKANAEKEFEKIAIQLANDGGNLLHNQYLELSRNAEYLRKRIEELSIELDTWDKAREICLNIADEIL